jgi:hypothetical protein
MSAGVVIAIAVGGTLVVFAAIVVLMVWLRRSYNADEQAALGRLNEELPRRGWTYEERNDSYVSVFNSQNQYDVQPLFSMPTRRNPLAPLQPYHLPPKAVAARHIITGTHRGRAFIAARFTVKYAGERYTDRVIWVRTPAPGPVLTVTRSPRLQSRVSKAIGQADLQLGNQDFDEQFEVSETDERFARAVLNPTMIQFLLTDPRRFRDMTLLGDHIDLTDPLDDHRDPALLIPALDLRCDLLDRVPPSAWT